MYWRDAGLRRTHPRKPVGIQAVGELHIEAKQRPMFWNLLSNQPGFSGNVAARILRK